MQQQSLNGDDNRAALIMRVSSKDQADGYSLDAQERFLKDSTERAGLSVTHVYPIAETASKEEKREKFNAAIIEVAEAGIPHLVFEKVDRLTRNFGDAAKIERWVKEDARRSVYFVKESFRIHKESSPNEWMMFGFQVTTAKGQAETIRREVLKGMREKLEQGWYPGRPMIGYMNAKGPNKKIVQVIDDQRKQHVRRLYELVDTGNYSIPQALSVVLREGFRTPEGRKPGRRYAWNILTDPFYIGEMHWGGKVYRGQYPLFIERDLFERVGRRIKKPGANASSYDWMFKGAFRCAGCGSTISWYRQKDHIYGDCKKQACPLTQTAREDRIDAELQARMAGLMVPPAWSMWMRQQLVQDTNDLDAHQREKANRVAALEQLVARARNKQDRLYDDRLDERISVAVYDRKQKELDDEVARLQAQIAAEQDDQHNAAEERVLFWDGSQTVAERYANATDNNGRRMVLREIFSNLTLRGSLLIAELKNEAKWVAEAVADYTQLNGGFELENNASPQRSALLRAQSCLLWYTLIGKLRAKFESNTALAIASPSVRGCPQILGILAVSACGLAIPTTYGSKEDDRARNSASAAA